ncbi:hypothetical protein BBP40_010504 [Aspergillus hancockii]|nr:hypothetical protein BBP40_010504 [Aspergillus hancockii]
MGLPDTGEVCLNQGSSGATLFNQSAFQNLNPDRSGASKPREHISCPTTSAFDAAFFNMRAEEAQNTDSQYRMMLECTLEAAEDAGRSLLELNGQKGAVKAKATLMTRKSRASVVVRA